MSTQPTAIITDALNESSRATNLALFHLRQLAKGQDSHVIKALEDSLASVEAAQAQIAIQKASPELVTTLQRWDIKEGEIPGDPAYNIYLSQSARDVKLVIEPATRPLTYCEEGDKFQDFPSLVIITEINSSGLPCAHVETQNADERLCSLVGLPNGNLGIHNGESHSVKNMIMNEDGLPKLQDVVNHMANLEYMSGKDTEIDTTTKPAC